MDRRSFLSRSGMTLAALTLAGERVARASAAERIRVGVVGTAGRARSLIASFASNSNAEIVGLADIDSRNFPEAVEEVRRRQGTAPYTVGDFRKLVDDKSIDALVVGTPDHWHAIPTIHACMAGKDVYVEKPDGHNIVEGQRMIAAQRKFNRVVQLGTQGRTTNWMNEAIAFIRTGALGKCMVAKAWETAKQGNIGRPADSEPPAEVDYDMWLGPAPKRPFNVRRFHGNWRWFYDYGTGDLGNDGVHRLDIARWALGEAMQAKGETLPTLPETIVATGGKWYFDDMQEWPDTLQVNYRFGAETPRILTYEMRLWTSERLYEQTEGSAVYGDEAYIIMANGRWWAYGPRAKLLASGEGSNHEADHVQNFLDCVKSREKPNADLETVGHPSSVLCHAGNIASRIERTLRLDAANETFHDDPAANALRTRPEYRKPWVLPEV